VAAGVSGTLRAAGAALYGAAWEARRRSYAAGWLAPRRIAARVVSVGNLTVGGTGKTTLTLHLAERARALGLATAVVCRNYRPGPGGVGDEALLYRRRLGAERVFTGRDKRRLAGQAAAAGFAHVLVDDGFSHWGLERDLDLVLLDASDLRGGGALLPLGRLREPLRALQRAQVVVVTRVPAGDAPERWLEPVRRLAPAARFAAGRHQVRGMVRLTGEPLGGSAPRRVRVVTATGNPEAVAASARESGAEVVAVSAYRDHHWFTAAEAARERAQADAEGAALLVTAKDAVRWPTPGTSEGPFVLEVGWRWLAGGEEVEAMALAATSEASA